jgi:hypothetical protein
LKAAVKKSENQPRRNEEHEVFFWSFLRPLRFFVVDSHCFRASQRDMNALQTPISYKKKRWQVHILTCHPQLVTMFCTSYGPPSQLAHDDKGNSRAEVMVLNLGHFAWLGLEYVPKRHANRLPGVPRNATHV